MTAITDALTGKQLKDLVAEKTISNPPIKPLTKDIVEEVIKYLKYQQGGLETDGMNEYMGFGDRQICVKLGITESNLQEIKQAITDKISEINK